MNIKKIVKYVLSAAGSAGLIATISAANDGGEGQNSQTTPQAVSRKTYEIYPKVQEISYLEGNYLLTENVNIVFESGIDEATVKRFKEVLDLKNLKYSISKHTVKNQTNILVGIKGDSDNLVDNLLKKENIAVDDSLYEKTDSYQIQNKNNLLSVLAKDTDAAFYGATTLWHIFNQLNGVEIENFAIKDYADVTTRGVIEGYYGSPWSLEDRLEYMKWGTYYKLNGYFYAPKDDPKHSHKWRELYTDEEIERLIKPLAETGNETKVRYIYTLHPFFGNRMTEQNYDESLKTLKAKFLQTIKAGVRQIGILADDAGTPFNGANSHAMQKKLLEDMVNWLKEIQPEYPGLKTTLPYVVQEYMGWGETFFSTFPKEVQVVMTGGRIWGEISENFTREFTKKVGRGPMLWINWPCSDNSKSHLILGGYKEFLHRNVDPKKIEGVIFNPMQQSQPSRVAVFGGADYTWNIWENEDEAEKAYEASFKYVLNNQHHDDEESNAFRELSKHLINQNMDGRVVKLEESVEIRDTLTEFKNKLSNDSYTTEDINKIQKIFDDLNKYSKIMINGNSNEQMKKQIIYWLLSFEELSKGVSLFMDALKDLQQKDTFSFIDHYNQAVNEINKSKTHDFQYLNWRETAEVGVQHIQPFVRALQKAVSKKYNDLLIPDKLTFEFKTNRKVQQDSPAGDVFDYSNQRQQVWQNGNDGTESRLRQGDYFDAIASRPYTLKSIYLKMGDRNDHFRDFKIQYQLSGSQTWNDLQGQTNIQRNNITGPFDPVYIENLNIENVKAVRVYNNSHANDGAWLRVLHFVMNQPKQTSLVNGWYTDLKYDGSNGGDKEVKYANDGNKNANVLFDNNARTEYWAKNFNRGAGGNDAIATDATLTFTFPEARKITKVFIEQGSSAAGDVLNNFDIEYQDSNNRWVKFGTRTGNGDKSQTFTGDATTQRIRVRNKGQRPNWWRIGTFKVGNDSPAFNTEYLLKDAETDQYDTTKSSLGFQLIHKTESTTGHDLILKPGKELGIDTKEILSFKEIVAEYTKVDGIELQYSKDGYQWTKLDTLPTTPIGLRFIKFKNTSTENKTFNFTKLKLTFEEPKVFGKLIKSDIRINNGWGDERNSHKDFDRNMNTATKFGGDPVKGNVAIYDLGKEIDLTSLKLYSTDGTADYPRDLDVLYSTTNSDKPEDWKLAFTIGDDVTDNNRDLNLSQVESGKIDSKYPNVKWWGNTELQNAKARYLKLLVKANYPDRALLFNEIVVNDNEYISLDNNPKFTGENYEEANSNHVIGKTIDNDLSSYYKPAKANGSLKYIVEKDKYNTSDLRIITQGENSNAEVKVMVYNTETKQVTEKELGKLTNNITEFKIPLIDNEKVVAFNIAWKEKTPSIVEIVPISKKQTEATNNEALTNLVASKPENYQTWIDQDKQNYEILETIAKETLKSVQIRQSTLDSLKESLEKLKTSARIKVDSTKLDQIIAGILSNEDELYTKESFNAYQFTIDRINDALKDKSNLTQEIVNNLENEYNDKKSKLVTLPYKKQSVTLNINKFDLLNALDYTKETYDALKAKVDEMKQKVTNQATTVEEFNKLNKDFKDLFSKLQVSEKGLLIEEYNKQKAEKGYKFIDKYYSILPELADEMLELLDSTDEITYAENVTKETIQESINQINLKHEELNSRIINIVPNDNTTTEEITNNIDESLVPQISEGSNQESTNNNGTEDKTQKEPKQPETTKPETKQPEDKKSTYKDNSDALIAGFFGSIAVLLTSIFGFILFKKRNRK
ncbi:beta-N-acetylglucosaminidase domain-containing protein [Mycoplasma sp. OR1901]|uniref:beta-N-acetylglucosaminidase domain-containing protein n=1 Tax=Mycoplasma sp. OR1901 TaxID=2742195 RepID=UPI001583BE16|nr:beta-N-acetylglucosaminidase domain-containing protein [Mycoplasma sp. OR1901]QKT05395.1 beta-N-acetylglucosaminidase domain-containing protein [Mycoplasma sp. OR1901]